MTQGHGASGKAGPAGRAGSAGIVYACIVPHGAEVIPELAAVGAAGGGTPVGAPAGVGGEGTLGRALAGFARLTRAMEEMGRRLRRADPDTVVVATPHNLRLTGGFTAVVTAESVAGSLTAEAPLAPAEAGAASGRRPVARATVEAAFRCDRVLACDIVARAEAAQVKVVGVNYGAPGGPNSVLPLDWGALIPLSFMGDRVVLSGPGSGPADLRVSVGAWVDEGTGERARPEVVLIGPSREAPREALVKLGEVVADAARARGRRVAFVASCDHGHAHLAQGPYGLDPASAVYDRLVSDVVRSGRLEDLVAVDPRLVEAAKPDSLWQMLILAGVLRRLGEVGEPLAGEFLAYEAPTYFGMLCASYGPRDP